MKHYQKQILQVSSQRSPAVKREGSGATGGAGAQRPIADSSTSSGKPSLLPAPQLYVIC